MREKFIETSVVRKFRLAGWYVRKYTSPARRSVPDDIFLKDGFVFFIEFKATGAKPTKNQLEEIAAIRKHGGIVYVVDSIAFGNEILLRMESLA